ncbi:MAG: exodeoxyribonuclease VII large subunit [Proteobacteria bacterium]|nr:exodeoxyribonuclease VII large subunit [Pseudomonadota bacterium]
MPESTAVHTAEREVFSPSQLARQARDLLEGAFALIWIEGEISNFVRAASGHCYFVLKDAQAGVRCAMFKPRSTYLRFRPADGMRVLARARVSLYEARGEFQLVIEHLEEAGEGALLRAFAELKARLAAEGLFDPAIKRAIPKLPRRIGIVTSPTGAAVRDVLSVIARRFPLAQVEILPVPVQGKDAPPAIVAMFAVAAKARRHDVLLLTRGGGSLEDLWAFNDESVARAIRACPIPVVAAIGHEIDFTIADFAADLRAPTPSAAAELLVPDAGEIRRALAHVHVRLAQWLRHRLHTLAQRADHALARLRTQHPRQRLRLGRERLGRLHVRLQRQHPAGTLARHADALREGIARLRLQFAQHLHARELQLSELARALNAVSPLATLQRGYAILVDRDTGKVVRSATAAAARRFNARLADGEIFLIRDPEH